MSVNRLILGDNLEILKSMESDSVDLIYLDPPFFSNRNYEVIWGDTGEIRSFQDRWAGGVSHYIDWLKERIAEMYRILKPTGSIFLHCDWHADAYIRVHILDRIFGEDNFRGNIIWQRHNAHNDARKKIAVLTDSVFYYSKSKCFTYKPIFVELSDEYKNTAYRNQDENGFYSSGDLTGAGINKNDIKWKGYHPAERNRHWAIPKDKIDELAGSDAYKLSTIEKLELLEKNNFIIWTSNGTPRFKRYLETTNGIILGNVWTDIQNVQAASKEKIGYPTQKPEALLERIISMASNEGDIVLDPFMGGGTTIAVANRLNRQWLGIDQSPMAVKVTEFRLQKQTGLFAAPYTVHLYKYDYDTLRYKDAFEFESWVIQQFGGVPQNRKGGDKGIDGKMGDGVPIQVKRSDNVPRDVIDKFPTAIQRYDKSLFEKNKEARNPVGYIIAFSFGKGAIEEVARLKTEDNIIIKLVKVEDIVPIAVKPVIGVHINELERDANGNRKIEFIARGQSPAGIEFYSWDFNYNAEKSFKPSVIIDKEGKQTLTLKAGAHVIAVKVVDNDGLENTEIVQLKINGVVERGK
jgi:DNA modification methylase